MFGLKQLLTRHVGLADAGRDGFFDQPAEEHRTPGYWVATVARARERGLSFADLCLADKLGGYAQAIGAEAALGAPDRYAFKRVNAGKTYSPLVLITSREQTEFATSQINGCIRHILSDVAPAKFTSGLCEVVGDLLDNVWAHGESTGFAMAQRWHKPGSRASLLEFAVADCGKGFLREVRRIGLKIDNHRDAIEWCIQQGHSTKKRPVEDPFAQRLPPDVMGNPMPGIGRVVESDNHHMGLGLAKLIEFTRTFEGWLWLASGDALLRLSPGCEAEYLGFATPWNGVALACRFDQQRIAAAKTPELSKDERLLAELLRKPRK